MTHDTHDTAPDLTLYNLRGCPYCIRVKKQLARFGFAYKEIQTPRLRGMRKEVMRISGQRQVPVLVHGDRVIPDSRAICEYLSGLHATAAPAAQPA